MIWFTWRQFRTQLITVYALLAAACITLALTGPRIADLAKRNVNLYDVLTPTDRTLFNAGIIAVAVTPAIIGIFWGAPLVARELETGTHRLVWNQSVTRTRWLAVKLGTAVLGTAVALGVLSAAVTWWAHPLDGAQSQQHGSLASRLTPIAFAMRGIVPIGYGVFALLLGTALGIVIRRSVPAMAVTLAIYVFIQVAMPLWVRPHLVPAQTEMITLSESTFDGVMTDGTGPLVITAHTSDPSSWILSNETVDAAGKVSALPAWFADCMPPPPGIGESEGKVATHSRDGLNSCLTRLTDEGYRQRLVYQPTSHFWPLQWAETGLFLGLSALLAWFSFWWVRRLS